MKWAWDCSKDDHSWIMWTVSAFFSFFFLSPTYLPQFIELCGAGSMSPAETQALSMPSSLPSDSPHRYVHTYTNTHMLTSICPLPHCFTSLASWEQLQRGAFAAHSCTIFNTCVSLCVVGAWRQPWWISGFWFVEISTQMGCDKLECMTVAERWTYFTLSLPQVVHYKDVTDNVLAFFLKL